MRYFFFYSIILSLLSPVTGWADTPRRDDPAERFLSSLPEAIRSNPVLVYHSRSLQGASFDSPRVILGDAKKYDTNYGSDTVYAFNGDPGHVGFDRIEAMEFDAAAARFKFYEITFGRDGNSIRSKDNPIQCMGCHRGPDPRPNWESYDFWTGIYGSNDDRLQTAEVEPFKAFLSATSSRPRYGTLVLNDLKKILGYSSHGGRLPGEPNITMTYKLSRANFKRVARLIMETPDYESYKFLIAGLLNQAAAGQGRLSDFVPDKLDGLFSYYTDGNVAEAQKIPDSIGAEYAMPSTLLFRSVFESRGIDVSSWFMNFKSGMNNTLLNGVSWHEQLLYELQVRDPELARYRYPNTEVQMEENRLADASRAALEKFQKNFDKKMKPMEFRTFAADGDVPQRIWSGACASCHVGRANDVAPQMNFDQARAHPRFKNLVMSGGMPLDQKLTASEKRRLLE